MRASIHRFLFSIVPVLLISCTGPASSFRMTNAYDIQVPAGASRVQAWLAMPQRTTEPAQRVSQFTVISPHEHRIVRDQFGNEYVYLDIRRPDGGSAETLSVTETFTVFRNEVRGRLDADQARALTAAERERLKIYLQPSTYVPVNRDTQTLARQIVGGETNPLLAARKLYDWVLVNIDYWVKDPANKKASPVGDAEYCLTSRTGNCTDFHSLWVSLARSAGIPSRIVYGSLAKPSLAGKDQDQSYHCWPEFYIGGLGWISHDVAVADIYHDRFALDDGNREKVVLTTALGYTSPDPAKVDYYFGNLDDRRVTWNRGRDLVMQNPRQAGPPINAMPKGYVEIDGKPSTDWTRTLTYVE